ncbi:MAG: hypothetical protein ACYDDE_07735 [bacterium]
MANIYKRGDVYWYQIRLEGKRFRESTKTDKKSLLNKSQIPLKLI